jgi:hypothetical protein
MHILDHADMVVELFLVVVVLGARRLVGRCIFGNSLKGIEHGPAYLLVCVIDGSTDVHAIMDTRQFKLCLDPLDEFLLLNRKGNDYRKDFEHEENALSLFGSHFHVFYCSDLFIYKSKEQADQLLVLFTQCSDDEFLIGILPLPHVFFQNAQNGNELSIVRRETHELTMHPWSDTIR